MRSLAFVEASWAYVAFVGPLIVLSVGLGIANGPASAGSTAAVKPEQVGSASGISNMARYVGAAVAVAAIAMIDNAVANNHREAGESAAQALAAGLGASALAMAIWSAVGILLIGLMRRQQHPAHARGRPRRRRRGQPAHDPGRSNAVRAAEPSPKVAV